MNHFHATSATTTSATTLTEPLLLLHEGDDDDDPNNSNNNIRSTAATATATTTTTPVVGVNDTTGTTITTTGTTTEIDATDNAAAAAASTSTSSSSSSSWCCSSMCCCYSITYLCCCCSYLCCCCSCTKCSSLWTNHKVLALSTTTHTIATFMIPICIIITHVLFIYGQTIDMWSLLLHNTNINLSYNVKSTFSQVAFSILKLPLSYQYSIQEKDTILRTFTYIYAMQELWYPKHMDGIGIFLPRLASIGLFLFSGVWPHLKLLALNIVWFTPFTTITRTSSSTSTTTRSRILNYLSIFGKWSLVDVLVVCIMVGVLHLQYTISSTKDIMDHIITHLNDIVPIIQSLYTAEDLCSISLKYSCINPKKIDRIVECQTCISTIKTWYHHPDSIADILHGIETSGNGTITLSVVGLRGIYAFCIAVICSIVLSFIVDYYDLQSKRHYHLQEQVVEDEQQQQYTVGADNNSNSNNNNASDDHRDNRTNNSSSSRTSNPSTNTNDNNNNNNNNDDDYDDAILNQLLLAAENGGNRRRYNNNNTITNQYNYRNTIDVRSIADQNYDRNIRIDAMQTKHIIWQMISYITFILILIPIIFVTMERKVYGAIPMLLHNLFNVVWTQQYNFLSLAYTTVLAGHWDYLLMSTFVWFIIAGPILRSILCIIGNYHNETSIMSDTKVIQIYQRKQYISTCIDFIGAFCAWEVFTIAVLMVDLLMPSITSTIFIDPRCEKIRPFLSSLSMIGSDDNYLSNSTDSSNNNKASTSCFEVDFNIHKTIFSFVIIGGIMLYVVSQHVRNNVHRIQ